MRLIIHILIVYTALAILSISGYFLSKNRSKELLAFRVVGSFWLVVSALFCTGNFPFLFLNSNVEGKSPFLAYYGYIELSIGIPLLIVTLFYLSRKQLWATTFFKVLCWGVIIIFSLTIIGIIQYINGFSLPLWFSWRLMVLYYLIAIVYLSSILMIRALANIEIFATLRSNYSSKK